MRYYEVGDSLLLQGQARVSHKGAELEAAEIVFRRDLDQVEARAALDSLGRVVGRPVLRKGDQTLRGERILYNLSTEQGTILKGKIHRDKGFYAGHLIQTRSSTEFHVHQGSYTTCDADHPHFDFYSPRIKVIAGDMAVARPVYFRIKERRLLWIPFYVFSLREDRQSGILTPSFGQRTLRFGARQSEWELRNLGYYLAPNDYWDLSLAADLRQRSGWLGRARLNYAARYRFRGHVSTQFENRQDGRTASRNWRLEFRHSQELGRDASLRANGTFQSNNSFAQDNSTSLQDRLNRTLRSNLSYTRRWRGSGNSFSLKASQTKYLDTERFSTVLPELSLRKSRKPIWGQAGPKPPKSPKSPLVQSHLLRRQRQPAQHAERQPHRHHQQNQGSSELARQRAVPPLLLVQPQSVAQPKLERPGPARERNPQPAQRPLLNPCSLEPDLLRPFQPIHRPAPSPAPRTQTQHLVQLPSLPRRHRRRLRLWWRRQPTPTPAALGLPPRQHLLGQNPARRRGAQSAPSPVQFLYGL